MIEKPTNTMTINIEDVYMEKSLNITSLTNTFDANLKSAIKVSGKDAKILYSEDENAKADSESWTEDINNAKSFKIVLQDNKLDVGEKVDISYDIEMPANLSYNQTAYTKLEMNYD